MSNNDRNSNTRVMDDLAVNDDIEISKSDRKAKLRQISLLM